MCDYMFGTMRVGCYRYYFFILGISSKIIVLKYKQNNTNNEYFLYNKNLRKKKTNKQTKRNKRKIKERNTVAVP